MDINTNKRAIIITGAASEFSALAALALADSRHTVNATMRDIACKNMIKAEMVH